MIYGDRVLVTLPDGETVRCIYIGRSTSGRIVVCREDDPNCAAFTVHPDNLEVEHAECDTGADPTEGTAVWAPPMDSVAGDD